MADFHSFNTHLFQIMDWHFSPETGSPFWLEKCKALGFDPFRDIRNFSDLMLFPDISDELRDIPVESLVPRGLKGAMIAGVFESGGTTGRPKRVIVFEEWLEQLVAWRLNDMQVINKGAIKNTLALVPSGPHVIGTISRLRARSSGGYFFAIDLDPRWVKKMIQQGDINGVDAYCEHIIDQAEDIINTQHISYLIVTPPLLERMVRRTALVSYLNKTLDLIVWGGTHMDSDTLTFLQSSVFPDVKITASYGSTMILGESKSRDGQDFEGSPIFDSFAPNVLFDVIDPLTQQPVRFGERGRVVMNYLSKFALFPNILERDTAVRLPRIDNYPGASVALVRPVEEISGQAVIEGVY
ncbi:phenazine antibiotic biosynthesis protein [Photorhabdus heterorhabditis]|uniref:phenazine antibiotic biosynthesis protein n=1 Tax=Photorhabdus heterorhabditis TaxID=880156 RepID=UPI001BD45BE2|nr:phenazine antibiotic biosynthesis protein [Photorhabdus heterorhabditis]MBS9443309.1 phenazine antibiotic biosynthesis protein [Photorhabdus heterorhabditis]